MLFSPITFGSRLKAAALTLAWILSACNVDPAASRRGQGENSARFSLSGESVSSCRDPDLNRVAKSQRLMLCNGTLTEGRLDLSLLKPELIKAGVTIAGVTGTATLPSDCESDGQTSCITTAQLKAADAAEIANREFRDSVQLAGVTGALTSCSGSAAAGCISNTTYRAVAAAALVPANLKSGVQAASVNGEGVTAPDCVTDGDVGCNARNMFAAAKMDVITGENLSEGDTLLGITGTYRKTRRCRDGANLAVHDTPAASNLPAIYALNYNASTNVGSLGVPHGLVNDYPIKVSSSGTVPAPLVAGTTYYAIASSNSNFKLAASPGGLEIDLTDTGTGSHEVLPAGNSVADPWDTVDDYNNGAPAAPAVSPWGAEHLCDQTNFTSAVQSPSLVPSNQIPAGANTAWTEIWRDNLSGLLMTNVLHNGVAGPDWASAFRICLALDSGDGLQKWRLPTIKEAIQLHIDGVARLQPAGLDDRYRYFWTATTGPYSITSAHRYFLTTPEIANLTKSSGSGVICVR